MTIHGRWLRHAAIAIALAVVAVGGIAPAAGGSSLGSTTYTDPVGDAPGAPDITAIAISDDASGLMQFTFTATAVKGDSGVFLFMDTDMNSATGSYGSDYGLAVQSLKDGRWWSVVRWDGNTFADVARSPSMGFTVTGDTYTVRLAKADIGNPASIAFYAVGSTFDSVSGDIVAADRAPDGGTWVYALSKAPAPVTVTPAIGKPTLTPAVPKAGKRLTVTFPLTQRETGTPLTGGTMTCDPQVTGKVLAHSESIGTGAARLSFLVPKTAKGKLLKVNLTIRAGGKTAHTVASFRVK